MGGQLLAVWFVIDALEVVNVLMVLGLVFASFWFGLDLVVVGAFACFGWSGGCCGLVVVVSCGLWGWWR